MNIDHSVRNSSYCTGYAAQGFALSAQGFALPACLLTVKAISQYFS
jgi:hypothetical protein